MRRKGLFFAMIGLTLLVAGWALAQETGAPAEAPKEAAIKAPAAPPEAAAVVPEPIKAVEAPVQSDSPVTEDGDGTAFVAMDPSESQHREELPAFPFLYSAYIIIWLGFFLYLISLGRRQRALDQKIAELSTLVSNRSSGD